MKFPNELRMHVLPDAIYDLACRIFPGDAGAIRRLTDALSDHDLKMLATIALRDGPAAAERYYLSRPRRLRVIKAGIGRELFR
jgi:hypothetical protein